MAVYRTMVRMIDNLNALVPLFTALGHPTVQPRHWRTLEAGMGVTLPIPSAKLGDGGFQV
jgi:hypothetical protein